MFERFLAGSSLHQLGVFVTVVEQGGYSAAAAVLDMAQPSVSYHVHSLEGSVGARLIVYENRSIHLTPEGEETLRAARHILNQADRLGKTIEMMRDGKKGRLVVGASIAFEHQFFFDDVVAPYVSEHPEVFVGLRFGHSIELMEEVAAGSLDLAYVNDWAIPAGVDFEFLHHSELVFLVSADNALASHRKVRAAEINDAGLISAPIEGSEVISYHEMLQRAGIRNPRVTLEIDGVQARKLAAHAGLGVLPTFVPTYAGDTAMDPLVTLRLDEEAPTLDFGIATREDQDWTPLMGDFGAWLNSVVAMA